MNRFQGPTIARRMIIGFGALLVLLGALLGSIYVWHQDSVQAQRRFSTFSRPLTDAAYTLEHRILQVGIALRAYMLTPDTRRLTRFESSVAEARELMRELAAMPMNDGDRTLLSELSPVMEDYLAATTGIVERRRNGLVDIDAEAHVQAMRESLIALTEQFVVRQMANTDGAIAEMIAAQRRVQRGLITTGLLSLLCFVVLAWLITQSVRRPARELVEIATALKNGDWKPALALGESARSGELADNEMARIGHAFGIAAIALEQREQRLAADRQVARASATSLDRAEVASMALRAIVAYVRAEIGVLYWNEGGMLEPVATHGATARALPVGEGLPGQAALERRTVRMRDIPRDAPFSVRIGYDEAPPREVTALPIVFRQEVIGVLLVATLRTLDEDAVGFLEDACAQLGVGLHNVRAYERIEQLLDELSEQSRRIQAQNEELQAQNEELQAQSEEIRTQNEQLAEQAEQLRRHAELLTEADRRKTEFLGLLAHELRNPLAGISNSLFVLSRPDVDNSQAAAAQAIIERQTRQLNRLIDDLLDVTRVTRGKVTLKRETLDLVQLVRDCLEDHRATFERARIALAAELPEGPLLVDGDRARLCQIIGNLADNAAKFTDEGRRVTVRLRADCGVAQLDVIDEGIGIDPAAFDRLFRPFTQIGNGGPRVNGGLGLGLALVKALVELHRGTVEAHSDGPGRGARFTVRLPLIEMPADWQPSEPQGALQVEAPRCRILIIEDNVDVAMSLSVALSAEGHEVRAVHDAREGLEVARMFRPEVLLCDIGLPVMDGYEVARCIRADETLRNVFLVAITGYASEHDREKAAQAGFDHHLTKPPDFERLSALLAEAAVRRARASSAA